MAEMYDVVVKGNLVLEDEVVQGSVGIKDEK